MNFQVLGLVLITMVFSSCSMMTKNRDETGHLAQSVLWATRSAEYRALCYQTFNAGRLYLDVDSSRKHNKPKAVVLDIDDTVLDNTPVHAKGVVTNEGYPVGWDDWVELEMAAAVPGVKGFIEYAQKLGYEIIYITNRKEHRRHHTLNNLKKLGLPAVSENLYMRIQDSSKKDRRAIVENHFHVAVYVGDNLDDHHDDFERANVSLRKKLADRFEKEFGAKFLLLPNAIYGAWDRALYDRVKLDNKSRDDRRIQLLIEDMKGI